MDCNNNLDDIAYTYVNEIHIYKGYKREDIALLTAIDFLKWSIEVNSIEYQFGALLSILSLYQGTSSKNEIYYYTEMMFNLIKKHKLYFIDNASEKFFGLDDFVSKLYNSVDIDIQNTWREFYNDLKVELSKIKKKSVSYKEKLNTFCNRINWLLNVFMLDKNDDIHHNIIKKETDNLLDEFICLRNILEAVGFNKLTYNELQTIASLFNILTKNDNSLINRITSELSTLLIDIGIIKKDIDFKIKGTIHLLNNPRFYNELDDLILASNLSISLINEKHIDRDNDILIKISDTINIFLARFYSNDFFISASKVLRDEQFKKLIFSYIQLLSEKSDSKHQISNLISLHEGCFYSKYLMLLTSKNFIQINDIDLFVHDYSQFMEAEISFKKGSSNQNKQFESKHQELDIKLIAEEDYNIQLPRNFTYLVQTLLKGEIVFHYYLGYNLFLFVASDNFYDYVRINISRKELKNFENLFVNMSRQIEMILSKEEINEIKIFLSKIFSLIEPGLSILNKNNISICKLTIISSNINLPFHLAYNKTNNKYLIQHYNISYSYSIESFIYSKEKLKSKYVSNILFSGYENKNNKKIKFVEKELNYLTNKYKDITINNDMLFLKSSRIVYEKISLANIFHFSGHIRGISKNKGWWALEYEDKDLVIKDFMYFNMENLFLMNLFGCSSAEQINASIGSMVGLLGSLVAKGVPNIVGFLWKINDKISKNISIRFYNNLLNNKLSISESLRLSILPEIESWENPLLWGSIIYYGAD